MATATPPRLKAKRLWTFDEMVARLPETNTPTELWDGELVMSPSPRPSHQQIVGDFFMLLKSFAVSRQIGQVFASPCDVVFSQRRVVQPDVLFVARANGHIVQDHIRGVPDLVAEVISEGSWRRDRVEKKNLYEQFGVREYWIIDPEAETIEVFHLTKGAYQLHSRAEAGQTARSKLLSGFTVGWSQLVV